MSLSLISSPFAVNATTNNLPFVVTSPSASSPQFKLVTDIYIPQRSSARLTRIKTAPSASLCMVDISRVVSDYLTYDTPMTISPGTGSYTNASQFRILMGEEYADSPSSSIVQYDGNGNVGTPNYTASFSGSTSGLGTLIPAVNEYSNLSYDFPQSEWYADYSATGSTPFLTNDPNFTLSGIINAGGTATKKAYDYDWETISILNDGQYNQVSFVSAKIISGSTIVFNEPSYYVSTIAPLLHIGIGPANLSASNSSSATRIDSGNWNYLEYDFEFVNGDNRKIQLLREDCNYYNQNLARYNPSEVPERYIKGRTRFAFINKYGVMDYYNVNNPTKKVAKIDRKDYTQPQLPWQTLNTSSGAIFDVSKRGKDTYSTIYRNEFEVTTDYVNQEVADWLTELIESPAVWIQSENLNNLQSISAQQYYEERASLQNGFVPIRIKNASYTWRTNKWSQKSFQYDIKWELSNTAETRR
jgi:hypothetical protein